MSQSSGSLPPLPFDRVPSSPCINVCRLAQSGDYCVGCRRTKDEISRWWSMTPDEKRELWRKLGTRKPDGSGEW